MLALRDIEAGEEITVKYNRDGYYGEHCMCSTCTGHSTRKLLRPLLEGSNQTNAETSERKGKRKGHRGGKNGKAKRAKRDAESDEDRVEGE